MTSTAHPASRVCSVSKLAGCGFFEGPFKIAVDGKIEHGKVAWPSGSSLGSPRHVRNGDFAPSSLPLFQVRPTCCAVILRRRGQLGRLYSQFEGSVPESSMNTPDPIASDRRQSASDRLNQSCLCVTLDRVALGEALEREAADPAFVETFIRPRAHLFSNVPVFLSADAVAEMQECVSAIEATTRLPSYQAAVLSWAPQIAQRDHGPVGALMGYDFHLGGDGPRLIAKCRWGVPQRAPRTGAARVLCSHGTAADRHRV